MCDHAVLSRRIAGALLVCLLVSPAEVAHARTSAMTGPPGAAPSAQRSVDDSIAITKGKMKPRWVRIAHLEMRWDSLSRAASGALRLRSPDETSDTVYAGVFRIATSRSLHARVEAAALEASRALQSTLDSASRQAIHGLDVAVVMDGDSGSMWRRPSLRAGAQQAFASCCDVPASSRLRTDPLIGVLRAMMLTTVTESFDGAMREWILQTPLPILSGALDREGDARLEIGVAGSQPARDCFAESARACALVLDLHGPSNDPLAAWYAPEDYRGVAERIALAPTDGRDAPRQQRECLTGDRNTCHQLLRSLDRVRIPAPMLQGPRLSLLRHALQLGGTGALQRLRTTPGDIGARLVSASGTDEASLLASWRTTITDPTQASVRPEPVVVLASLCWLMTLGAFGYTRISRCR